MAGFAGDAAQGRQDYAKWLFFVFFAVCVIAVVSTDERFLVVSSDPEWAHIRTFRWLLLPHGLAGAVALLSGPLQFSDRLRAARPALHRATGWVFIVAASITAIMGSYIGTHFDLPTIHVEEYFHGGLILVALAFAFLSIRNRNIAAHKLWMMRSYAVLIIFVWARIPDVLGIRMNGQVLADVLWSGDVLGMIAPDVILTTRELLRRRARRLA